MTDSTPDERVARSLYQQGFGFDIDADPTARDSMLAVARTALEVSGLPDEITQLRTVRRGLHTRIEELEAEVAQLRREVAP